MGEAQRRHESPALSVRSLPPVPPPRSKTSVRCAVCLGLSGLTAIGGLLTLSQATLGIGLIACACLLAIAGRIAQAADYHHARNAREGIRRRPPVPEHTNDPNVEFPR